MTTDGSFRVMQRLMALFPAVNEWDQGRRDYLIRELDKSTELNLMRAIDEYMTLNEKFLNPTQLMAIAHCIGQQALEREAAIEKARRFVESQDELKRRAYSLKDADIIIAEMTDEDVLREWAPILAKMKDKAHEWAEKWPVEKVRNNIQLRLHVAGLTGAAT